MKFDSALSEGAGFGKFQIQLFLIQFLSRMTLPCHFLLNNFIAAVPSHHCNITALDNVGVFWNLTQEQQLVVGVPKEQDGTLSSCRMFSEPQYQLLSGRESSEDAEIVPCRNGLVYDKSTFRSTLATEWDLVCSRKLMNKATATAFFIGVMVGSPLFGYLSDRALSTSFLMFAIMRFLTGMCLTGIAIISFVLNVEWVNIDRRTFAGIIISLDVSLGSCILPAIAYFVNEWRMLILAVTSPLLLSVIAWRWLPESARWLSANGRAEAAHQYIMKCAEMNNRTEYMEGITPETLLESSQDEATDAKYTFVDIFKTPNIRWLSIWLGILWCGAQITYFGIWLNISGFGVNIYLTQFIFAAIEFPTKTGAYFFIQRIGRRPGEMGALLSTGVCLLINLFVAEEKRIIRTVVGVFGKALSEASCAIIYLYTAELYPTVVRQNGLGYTSFVAWLAVSVSPFIVLLEDVWYLLPALTYCAVAFGSGLVASLLPETLNARLPETIEDIERPRKTQ
ncbi:solute carrier family 22 member 7-like isoform X2 [Nelusetta ayraudi]|uniref:solute carrier family 22 member 7-like isoform X2 n=1 Tax=Nelusetta ayraudi TaxID=303726 RepID=UPI003F6F7423